MKTQNKKKPLTQEQWRQKNLTALKRVVKLVEDRENPHGIHLWAILTALRGPDFVDSSVVKCLTTERVRAVVGLIKGDYFMSRTHWLVPDEIKKRNRWIAHSNNHFGNHYIRAVAAIRALFGYDLDTETKC